MPDYDYEIYIYDLNHARWRGPNTGEDCGACR